MTKSKSASNLKRGGVVFVQAAFRSWTAALVCLMASGVFVRGEKAAQADVPGSLTIAVTYAGTVPKSKVPDHLGKRRDILHVHKKSKGLAFVVAYLLPSAEGALPDLHVKAKPSAVHIEQKDLTFIPHVVSVKAGQPVKFTNDDSDNHNVRTVSLDPKNQFNMFTPTDGAYVHRFRADRKQRPVQVGCSIHAWMRAWIYVFEHPFHGVSDRDGKLAIARIPPGKYRLAIRQPDVGFRREQTIEIKPGKMLELQIRFAEKELKIP